jgi:hypothetical protein
MVAALGFALEHGHGCERRDLIGGARTGDAAADDENVGEMSHEQKSSITAPDAAMNVCGVNTISICPVIAA